MARIKSKMRAVESTMASAILSVRREEVNWESTTAIAPGSRIAGEGLQLAGHHTKLGQLWSDVPGLLDLMLVQPAHNLIFATGLLRFGWLALPAGLAANLVFPGQDPFSVLGAQAKTSKIETFMAINAQLLQNAGGGTLRSRSGIVQLVSQIARKLTQSVQLF